jgi:hypothetical protein
MTATQPRSTPTSMGGLVLLAVLLVAGTLAAAADPFTLLFFTSYAVIGAFLVYRRPRNSIGWLLVGIGFAFIGTTTRGSYDLDALASGTATTGDFVSAWIAGWAGSACFAGFVALAVLFPSGHLPGGRWQRPAAALLAAAVAVVVLTATGPGVSFNPDGGVETILIPNRFGVFAWLPIWSIVPVDLLVLPVIVLLAIAVVGLLARYHRAAGVLRLQLRWLVAAVTFVVVAVVFGLSTLGVFGVDIGGYAWIPAIVAYPTVPIAIGIAVLRYRLYEIDRIISRTIGWVVVTAILAAVFAAVVVGLQVVLEPATGNNTLAVAASTLVAAALFQPLRGRVQRAVDRRFNRSRADAERAIGGFVARVRDEVVLDELRTALVATADEAVRPVTATVWLRGGEGVG